MISSVDSTNSSQPLFPEHPDMTPDITMLVLKFLAQTTGPDQIAKLARLNKSWKAFIRSERVTRFLFTHYFSSFQNHLKIQNPVWDKLGNWTQNVFGKHPVLSNPTCVSSQALFITPALVKPTTDGRNWIAHVNSEANKIMRSNVVNLCEAPKEVAPIEPVALTQQLFVLGNSIGVLKTVDRKNYTLIIYDVSSDFPHQFRQFHIGNDVTDFSLLNDDGFIFRTKMGELFYQSGSTQEPPVKLSSEKFTASEITSRNIPLFVSEGGYYLAPADKIDHPTQRHYWQLKHVNRKNPIETLPFTTQQHVKIALTDQYLAAYELTTRELHVYRLAQDEKEMQVWKEFLPDLKDLDPSKLGTFITIWGQRIVITHHNCWIRILELNPELNAKSKMLFDGIFYDQESMISNPPPFINPNGLNFFLAKFGKSEKGSMFKLVASNHLLSLSFPSSLTLTQPNNELSTQSIGGGSRRSARIAEAQKRKNDGTDQGQGPKTKR